MINFIFIGISFLIYILVSLWAKSSSSKEFYVAGSGVSPLANGMATAADWMSAATFISMAGIISFKGYDGSVFLIGWTGGFVLLTTLMVPFLRKFGKFTVPDFIGDRYYSSKMRVLSIVCVIFVCLTYISGQMRGVGVVFSNLFHISPTMGVLIGSLIVLFYAGIGGMKGITYTQVSQYIIMILAYTIPAIFISILVTGHFFPQLGFVSNILKEGKDTGISVLENLDSLNKQLGFAEYTSGSMSKINLFCITAALMFGTAGLPHVIVRFFTVKDVQKTRKSAAWTLLFIAVLYTTAPAIAAFSRTNFIQTIDNKEYQKAPDWFKNWEKIGLVSWVDKNNDGVMNYAPGSVFKTKGEPSEGKVISKKPIQLKQDEKIVTGKHNQILVKNEIDMNNANEVYVDRDIMIMANPQIAGLPKWLEALVMAGCVAAALSTAAGLLLVMASAISHDLIKRTINPKIKDKQELFYARVAITGAIIISAIFGINPPGFVAQVVSLAFGIAASTFFPTIIMGIFSKRTNREGGFYGMLAGLVFTCGYILIFVFLFPQAKEYYLFGISPQGIGFVGMFINFIVTILVSYSTKKPPQEIVDMVENIRIPKNTGKPMVK